MRISTIKVGCHAFNPSTILSIMEWYTQGNGMNGRPFSWSQLHRIYEGTDTSPLSGFTSTPHPSHTPSDAQPATPTGPAFAELHACSNYSFLRGASSPADMVRTAVNLGYVGLALVDRDGFYGAVQFAEAAAHAGLPTVFGAELTLGSKILTVLAKGPEGYRRLSHTITDAKMSARTKGEVNYPSLEELGRHGGEHWVILADHTWLDELDTLTRYFPRVVVEKKYLLLPDDDDRHEQQIRAAHTLGIPIIATAAPTAARPKDARLAAVKAALAQREDLSHAQPHTHPLGGTFLARGDELYDPDYPEHTEYTVELAQELAFRFDLVAPNLPDWPVPPGHTEASYLKELVYTRAPIRYGTRTTNPAAWKTLDYELDMVEALGFPGYFLIVSDIADFCTSHGILAQGRGSSANSAICYALGITNVDPVAAGLLFERFLSPERDGPPDIDLDIESGRREEVIQYCYTRYGRDRAAQVANVITYRTKGALRDAARALGYPQGRIDRWMNSRLATPEDIPHDVRTVADMLKGHPRHLGIHSAGMVICDRPIADVVPVEWARRAGRSVIEWDKDDSATVGLVKFDLLGLGMLEALHHAIDLVESTRGVRLELWQLGFDDPAVYDMLCAADAVGVFQVESRAQMATLPRLKPREFYDLVVQVALVRPGPIQGGSVHPYIRRRNGEEDVTFDHECLQGALAKTLGVPLFQEQVMRVAVDAAGFSPSEADTLRRAMGSKRSPERMNALTQRFTEGCRSLHGMDDHTISVIWKKIIAFAAYGFPESHAQSFASLVYFSAWFKKYFPAEFTAALLHAQPMGFYSPQSLVADARRHGVTILPADVNTSHIHAHTEYTPNDGAEHITPHHMGTHPLADVRLGLASIRGIGEPLAAAIVDARATHGPFTTLAQLSRRAGLTTRHLEALAAAGALDSLGVSRREGLWAAGVAATEQPDMLEGLSDITVPALPGMSAFELMAADIATTGITPDKHPVELLRERLDQAHILPVATLTDVDDGSRQVVAGVVTHRQRPHTAHGTVFLGLEDETGLTNILCSPGFWQRYRTIAAQARLVAVRGIVQNASGAVTVVADKIETLDHVLSTTRPMDPLITRSSRDFR